MPSLHHRSHLYALVILIAYLIVGVTFIHLTPDWQAPDEPAHYNYIRQVSESGRCCPIIEAGDWQNEYQSALLDSRFAPEWLDRIETVRYEDHQPPLYYLFGAVIDRLTNADLKAIRFYSLVLGAGVIFLSYLIGMRIFPTRPWMALSGMAFMAFLPQHLMILSSVNNDALAELWVALLIWEMVGYLQHRKIPVWRMGLWVGLGFFTKTTVYFMAAVVPFVILLRWYSDGPGDWKNLFRSWVIYLIPALVIGGLWWLRNIGVYGFPDFLALGQHDQVVIGQLRSVDRIQEMGFADYFKDGLATSFRSFWGQFGWMSVPMEDRFYQFFLLFSGIGLSGFILNLVRPFRAAAADTQALTQQTEPSYPAGLVQRNIWFMLFAILGLSLTMYSYYNTSFVQFQGRYIFVGLIPIAYIFVTGFEAWRRLLLGRWGWTAWLLPLVFSSMAGIALYMLSRYIVNMVPL